MRRQLFDEGEERGDTLVEEGGERTLVEEGP